MLPPVEGNSWYAHNALAFEDPANVNVSALSNREMTRDTTQLRSMVQSGRIDALNARDSTNGHDALGLAQRLAAEEHRREAQQHREQVEEAARLQQALQNAGQTGASSSPAISATTGGGRPLTPDEAHYANPPRPNPLADNVRGFTGTTEPPTWQGEDQLRQGGPISSVAFTSTVVAASGGDVLSGEPASPGAVALGTDVARVGAVADVAMAGAGSMMSARYANQTMNASVPQPSMSGGENEAVSTPSATSLVPTGVATTSAPIASDTMEQRYRLQSASAQ